MLFLTYQSIYTKTIQQYEKQKKRKTVRNNASY